MTKLTEECYDGQYICPACLADCAAGYYCPNGCSKETRDMAHKKAVSELRRAREGSEKL